MTTPVLHPEIELLKSRFHETRNALRDGIEQWHVLSNEVRPRLNATYDRYFGELERELQFASLAGAEIFRRVELLSIKVARGEKLTTEIIDLINHVVNKEYARFKRRLHEAFNMDTEQRERSAQLRVDAHDDEELVKMYRTLVKKLHPDAAGESAPGTEAWHRVQNAYRDRNVSQLRSLLAFFGVGDASDLETRTWGQDRWTSEVQSLERRLHVEERKLARLKGEEPFAIEGALTDEVWREQHIAALQASIQTKLKEIDENNKHYRELTGGCVPLGSNALKSTDEQGFEEDFMKNTYFGQR